MDKTGEPMDNHKTRQPAGTAYINSQAKTQANWQKGANRVGFNLEDDQNYLQTSTKAGSKAKYYNDKSKSKEIETEAQQEFRHKK